MVPSRVNEPLSCPGSGGSRDSAKGSARGGTGARRPRLQTLLRGTRRGAGPGARRAGPGARRPLCHPHSLPPPGPNDPTASPLLCSAPWRPPTLAGPKGTRASLPATSGLLITSAAHCQDLAGGHAPGGRGPGTRATERPAKRGFRPTRPSAPPPVLSYLAGHQPSALGAHGVAWAPPALARATTRARPASCCGRMSSAPWAPGAPSPALALPAPPAPGRCRRGGWGLFWGGSLGTRGAPGRRRRN